MALAHSPKLATNGLIFYYDMDNTVKSFKGKPTTNYANTESKRSFVEHSSGAYGNDSTITDAPEKGPDWKKITVLDRGSNFRIAQFPYIAQPDGTTRTYSVEYEIDDNISSTSYYIRGDGTTGYGSNQYLTGSGTIQLDHTNNSGQTRNLALFLNHNTTGVSGLTDTIYFRHYQVEDGSFATPFTEGTRSSTQSILDMTKNPSTITSTNLSYDSDGTFEFDGTDDYIDLPNNLGYTTQVSPFAWFKSSGTPAGSYHIIMGGLQLEISIHSSDYLRVGVSQGGSRFVSNHGTGILDGNWHYIGFTFDGSTKTAYIDGEPVGTQSVSEGLLSTTFTRRIGRFGGSGTYYANGQIGAVQIYNRSLTSDEVKNNYNTLRRRYGI